MLPSKKACLLTGEPGCGKTSVIIQGLARAGGKAGGFYTEEMRSGGVRSGFRIVTLDGKTAVLASTGIKGPPRVGRYGVDVKALDTVAVPAVREAIRDCDVVVIDEIGKMEMFSDAFREEVLSALASGKKILGTITMSAHAWADAVRRRPDVGVVTVSRANRDAVVEEVVRWLGNPD